MMPVVSVGKGNWEHLETSLNFAVTNVCLFLKPMWYWMTPLRPATNDL